MEARDQTPLVGGILVVIALLALIGLGAFTLAGRGTGEVVETESTAGPTENGNSRSASQGDQQQPGTAPLAGEVDVEIEDFAFSPATMTIKKGTKVTWTNKDTSRHDVMPDDEGADAARSQLLAKGESYSYTFNTVGTFSYHCTPHPYMKASITVVE